MSPEGVLIRSTPDGSWAWTAVRLAPATDLADSRGYADVTEERRHAEAVGRERDWLTSQWVAGSSTRFEVRYVSDPRTGLLTCAVIGQVHAADPAGTESAAVELRRRLDRPPPHVRAVPVRDAAEVAALLAPFRPGPAGIAEIRKVISRGPITRRDVRGERLGLAVPPLPGGRAPWEPVWTSLARQPRRTAVSVCLEPWSAPPGFTARLTYIAQVYGELARQGVPDPLWQRPVPPDPFARYAEQVYLDAARRYAERGYRMRVTVACEGPPAQDDRLGRLAEEVARTVSGLPGAAQPDAGWLPHPSAVVRRPPSGEAEAAADNLLGLNRRWLEETYWQEVPLPCREDRGQVLANPGTVRILSDLLDLDEAAAVFPFPYQVPNRPPLFTDLDEDGTVPHDAGARPTAGPIDGLPGYPGADFRSRSSDGR